MSTPTLLELSTKLSTLLQQLSESTQGPDHVALKQQVSAFAQDIIHGVTEPAEMVMTYGCQLGEITAIRNLMAMKVFDHIPIERSSSYDVLAEKSGASEELIRRFARMLVARNILKADGRDAVSHTKFSMIYAGQNPLGGFINLMGGQINNSLLALPSFFSKNGFKSPLSPNNTPLAFGLGREGVPYWDIMKEDPATLATFHAVMAAQEKKLSDRGVYDYSWILQRKDDGALVVDVGGSRGHVLKQTMEETPGLEREAGRLVLQDRAEVIEEAKKNADGALKEIKMMEHDFFTEQPVKGASIYYLRRILHDWSDDQSRVILSHLADAMSPDSRVLISENIVQEDPPTDLSAMMDMVMMTISGKERSERDWEDLVQKSGLRVVKIWRKQGVEMGIVECAKA